MVLVCDPVTVWRTVRCNPALTQWLLRLAPVSLRPWGGRSVGEQMDVFFFFLFWPFCLFASISVASFFSLPSHLVFSPCLMTITCVSFVFLFSLMVGAVTPVCYYHHSSLPDLVGSVELFLSLTRSHVFFFFLHPDFTPNAASFQCVSPVVSTLWSPLSPSPLMFESRMAE